MKSLLCLFMVGSMFGPSVSTGSQRCIPLIETYADQYVWKTKVENGITYVRKFNVTKNCWEGPWIRVN